MYAKPLEPLTVFPVGSTLGRHRMALPNVGRITMGLLLAAALAAPVSATAQDKPRSGGELIFVVPSEPPSYDAHEEETFGVIHPLAPHYSTLLKVDPFWIT